MQTINLYSDYEGYPKIVLTEESSLNETIFKVQLLEFHFDEVLSFIPLGEYNPDSVICNYLIRYLCIEAEITTLKYFV